MALTRFVRSRPDLLFALGLTVVGQVEIWTREIDGEHAAYAALALPITLALAWRRSGIAGSASVTSRRER